MRVLALDFDGVISDSAPESFLVALRTWDALRPGSGLAADAARLAGETAPPLAQVRSSRLYSSFLSHMPLGNRAEDYAVVLAALEQDVPLPDQAAYDAWRDRQDPAALARFHEHFYVRRGALAERDPAGWRALMAPYSEFTALLRRRAADAVLAIATAKDRRSVEALLRLYGLDDLFPAERLLDKETGVGKAAHLARLQEQTGVPFPEIAFVDDKVNHLDGVRSLGVRCALAAWGYNGAREEALARQRGYAVLRLEDAEGLLFAPGPGGNPP
ncbi:MAG: HAD family hydrolase [Myxococcota bacterium]